MKYKKITRAEKKFLICSDCNIEFENPSYVDTCVCKKCASARIEDWIINNL